MVTAFSKLASPAVLVFGTGMQSAAIHHKGKRMKPMKNNHAWRGEPGSSSVAKCNPHSVSLSFLGGFRGSRIWNLVDVAMEGACGETRALIGMDICDMDWRRS